MNRDNLFEYARLYMLAAESTTCKEEDDLLGKMDDVWYRFTAEEIGFLKETFLPFIRRLYITDEERETMNYIMAQFKLKGQTNHE